MKINIIKKANATKSIISCPYIIEDYAQAKAGSKNDR